MLLVVAGIVLVVVAAALAWYARSRRALRRDLGAAETSSCGDVVELHQAVSREAGPGRFGQACELVGTARPGERELTGPFSGEPCVWYRAQVTHHFRERERRTRDNRSVDEWVDRTKVVADERSEAPFVLDDGTGAVVVDPRSAQVDGPEKAYDRFEAGGGGEGGSLSVLGVTIALGSGGTQSVGFQRREWLVRPDARLYVIGEASDRSGRLVLGKPSGKGRFLVSTRSEEEILSSARRRELAATAGAAVAGIAGVALVVAALVT